MYKQTKIPEQGTRPKRKILRIILGIVLVLLIIFSGFVLYGIYQNTQEQKSDIQLAYNTLHQIIANNEKVYDALELERPIFSLKLDSETTTDNNEETFLTLAEELQENFQNEKHSVLLTDAITRSLLKEKAENLGFGFLQQNTRIRISYMNHIVTTIVSLLDKDGNKIEKYSLQSSIIDDIQILTKIEEIPLFLGTLKERLEENLKQSDDLYKEIIQEFSSSTMAKFIKKNTITIERKAQSSFQQRWDLRNQLKELVVSISLHYLPYDLLINEKKVSSQQTPSRISKIRATVYQSSYSTLQEKANLRYLARLKDLFISKTYKEKLQGQGLAIDSNYTSDTDYHYFDLLAVKNPQEKPTKIGAFAIQKNNGELWIMDKDNVPLRSADLSIGKEEINNRSKSQENSSKNILLMGTHNNLADTIILLHITKTKKIKLISIPRDLYYAGQKINWYSKFFSHANLLRIVEEITGLPVDSYVAIDMYAFANVIDILGGITVFLDKDIVDPSYRIKENGTWSYLNYPKGEYELGGIEALRIARSRNTTTDFDRSHRQKLILEGIRKKINSLDSFSSVLSGIEILTKIRKKISTNLKIIEIATLISQYKDVTLDSRLTLSTANILYQTFTELHKQNISLKEYNATEQDPNFFLGNYILLPKDNDWNTLKKYIERYILE